MMLTMMKDDVEWMHDLDGWIAPVTVEEKGNPTRVVSWTRHIPNVFPTAREAMNTQTMHSTLIYYPRDLL